MHYPQPKESAMPTRKVIPISREAADMIATVARIEERTNGVIGRIENLDARLDRLMLTVEKIVTVEERQANIREMLSTHISAEEGVLDSQTARLVSIEQKMPALMETRKWIVVGVMGIMALVGMKVWEGLFSRTTVTAQVSTPPAVSAPTLAN